jgi:hypothetical protein
MASESQINANRENAKLSTGPKSEQGKAKSSHNAIKAGLTGHTVLLPTENAEAYRNHIERFFHDYQPANDAEKTLVQSIADTEWRLARIPSLESGIYAIGRRALAAEFSDEEDLAVRTTMIESQIFLTYRKDLSNLALQEARLRRHRDASLTELKELQSNRKSRHDQNMHQATLDYQDAKTRGASYDPSLFGFEFTTDDIQEHLDITRAKNFVRSKSPRFLQEDYEIYMTRRKAQKAA